MHLAGSSAPTACLCRDIESISAPSATKKTARDSCSNITSVKSQTERLCVKVDGLFFTLTKVNLMAEISGAGIHPRGTMKGELPFAKVSSTELYLMLDRRNDNRQK